MEKICLRSSLTKIMANVRSVSIEHLNVQCCTDYALEWTFSCVISEIFVKMFSTSTLSVLLGTILLISSIPDAVSFSKYGRTCKDIGCMRDEVCVMAEDPCSIYQRDNCGRYPTCMKSRPGEANCASTLCGENEYCKTENGVPTCVKKSAVNGFESAGVSYVNGQRVNTDEKHLDKTTASNSASNSNPYANANAPPAPAEPAGGYRHQVNSATNLGYPPYPSSDTGSKSGYPSYPGGNTGSNNGYPPYPSPNQGNRQQDLGYPPYPTHNKMPMPGQSNYPSYPGQPGHSNYPVYPGQQPGYPGYPQQLPGHQNYPYPNYPNQNRMYHNNVYSGYRRNSAIVHSPCSVIVYLAGLVIALANRS